MEKKTWCVEYEVTGYVSYTIDAPSKEDALRQAEERWAEENIQLDNVYS